MIKLYLFECFFSVAGTERRSDRMHTKLEMFRANFDFRARAVRD